MQIKKDTVVSLSYELTDSEGNLLEKSEQPVSYLHGGYDGIFPLVEQALEGKTTGEACDVTLEPDDAFGEYDSDLVNIEPRNAFPSEDLEVGMQFEGATEGSGDALIYTVTDITEDQVVVDANHPLAGQTLNFSCTVVSVRDATENEVTHGHVHQDGDDHD